MPSFALHSLKMEDTFAYLSEERSDQLLSTQLVWGHLLSARSCAEQCGFGGTTFPFPLWPCLLGLWPGVRGFAILPGWKQNSCCLRHSAPERPSWPDWWLWSGPRLHFSLTSRWMDLFQPPVLSETLASAIRLFLHQSTVSRPKGLINNYSWSLLSLRKSKPNGTQVSLLQGWREFQVFKTDS